MNYLPPSRRRELAKIEADYAERKLFEERKKAEQDRQATQLQIIQVIKNSIANSDSTTAQPIEILRKISNKEGRMLLIFKPEKVTDEYPTDMFYGHKFHFIEAITTGWLMKDVIHTDSSVSSGWGETTHYPARDHDALLTTGGTLFGNFKELPMSSGWMTLASSRYDLSDMPSETSINTVNLYAQLGRLGTAE